MSAHLLSAFEQRVLVALVGRAGVASSVLYAWAEVAGMPTQTVRSLVDLAQLGVTEQIAVLEVLEKSIEVGLLEATDSSGFRPRKGMQGYFKSIAVALNAIDFYLKSIHRDATSVRIVLTKPPMPSLLERNISELGWKAADLEATERAFHSMVRMAQYRLVVMTPFFDIRGSQWLKELFSLTGPGIERVLILRSLEDSNRNDYPVGFDVLRPWFEAEKISVFNYSIPRIVGGGRETFHAKVISCDDTAAYVGSANITAASLEHSMEMGVALSGRAAAKVTLVMDAVLRSAIQIL